MKLDILQIDLYKVYIFILETSTYSQTIFAESTKSLLQIKAFSVHSTVWESSFPQTNVNNITE